MGRQHLRAPYLSALSRPPDFEACTPCFTPLFNNFTITQNTRSGLAQAHRGPFEQLFLINYLGQDTKAAILRSRLTYISWSKKNHSEQRLRIRGSIASLRALTSSIKGTSWR